MNDDKRSLRMIRLLIALSTVYIINISIALTKLAEIVHFMQLTLAQQCDKILLDVFFSNL